MRHQDSVGNVGLLEPGSVQWMTAGRGIVHSEMPEQEAGRMAGFQLWVNLPAKDQMQAPAYRDVPPAAVPAYETEAGVRVRDRQGRVAPCHPRRGRAHGDPGQRARRRRCPHRDAGRRRRQARVLLVAGRPLAEPIAQCSPFVMNTSAEIQRAVSDFQRGALAT